MSQILWTNAERESLYLSAIDNLNEITGAGEIDETDPGIDIIRSNHEVARDHRSIWHKLCEMGFVKRRGAKGFRLESSEIDLHGYGAHPVYKAFTVEQQKVAQEVLVAHWNSSTSAQQLVGAMCEEMDISETHAQCWLVKQGIVLLQNPDMAEDESPIYILAVNPKDRTSATEPKLKRISEAVKKEINSLRSSVSGLYNSYAQLNPALIFSNDGTGTGKSYSVLDQYVANTFPDGTGRGHRNMVFMTPQKAQIKFDPSTLKLAEAKGIKFLGFYSKDDACNLDFNHWVTGEKTERLFEGWIKALKNSADFRDLISEFEASIQNLKYCMASLARLEKDADKISLDRLEEDKKRMQNNIRRLLKALAETAMNNPKVDPAQGGNHYFASTDKKDKLIASILDHVVPLERAKYEPCVLMSTTDKFIHTTPVFKHGREGFVLVEIPFDYVIGGKLRKNNEEGIKDANGQPIEEQMQFIRDELFKTDSDNHFLMHDISFTIIIDEEHIAHDKILNSRHKTLFDHFIKIPHVLNTVYRIINRVNHSDTGNGSPMVLQQTYKDFYDDLTYLFNNRCDSKFKIEQILSMFQANLGDMSIDGRDVEQVIGICKNVFSVTPKRFYNENALKKIRFRSMGNDAECRIYFTDTADNDDSDQNPSMHDLMQVTLCVFGACARLKDDKMINWFSHNSLNNQNSLLTQFIKIARRNKSSVESMFYRIDSEDLNVDEFYAYFTPKIVFSIEKLDDLPLSPADLEDAIHVAFKAELFEELPEVSVMRMLHNTKNSVITLSATSGFHGSYSGNYARDVLAKFGQSAHHSNLGFKSITRIAADVEKLTALRDARKTLRKVEFSSFADTNAGRLSSLQRGKEFDETLRVWCKPLEAAMKGRNKYRTMELRRNVEALLMACWDAKDTLALALTNNFSRTFRDYLEQTQKPLGHPTFPVKDCRKIFEIKPFNNGVTVRVVLFDADLNKQLNIDDHMKVDANTKVAFFAAYQTAGTGLNLFTKDLDEVLENDPETALEQDFERLILINSPFYSSIKTKAGLHTAMNYILALKHYASSGGMTIESFDKMLKSPEFRRKMMAEHWLSILKDIMQAIGRVERRDTHIDTEIYLPETLLEDISLQFSLINIPENGMLVSSMSMLNKSLMDFCLEQMGQKSFATEQEREAFSDRIAYEGAGIDHFMGIFLRKQVLKNARAGDIESAKLNELLRSMACVKDPHTFVARIKAHPLIKGNAAYEEIVDSFYIKMPPGQEHIKLCWAKGIKSGLTDYCGGASVYRPYESAVPEYTNTLSAAHGDTACGLINGIWNLNKDDQSLPLPHPAMLPLIKGNVGEDLFRSFMALYGLNPMKLETLFTEFSPKAYELFDSYILKGKKLLCVDVKNWSSHLEDGEQSTELVDKAVGKRDTLIKICEKFGYEPVFIYVNARYDRNGHNTMSEFNKGQPIHYMNLFKVNTHYKASKKFRSVSKVNDTMEFNESLIKVMTQ